MQKFNQYQGMIAEYYDLFYEKLNRKKEIEFYKSLILQFPGKTLEPFCGTGRFMLPLLRQGIDMEGLDSSAEMLKIFKNKGKEYKLFPNLYHEKIENFNINQKYSNIVIPFSSFMLLNSREEVESVLLNFCDHLVTGGQLLLEITAWSNLIRTYNQENQWIEDYKIHLPSDRVIIHSTSARNNYLEGLRNFTLKFEEFQSTKLIRTEIQELRLRLYTKYEMKLLLEKTGFFVKKVYGGFHTQEVVEQDYIMIFHAIKS